ncbi:MAG TPA: response regulator transcription factor [Verrucomicrobiae bacterium]|nr:response regulator transcription factor [Verrucomicrobiae bacterium]
MKAEPHAALADSLPNGNPFQESYTGKRTVRVIDGSTRILLVDDHPVLRKGLISCLSDRAGFAVVGEASDGLEAIRKVGELQPDIVLMDVEMPHLDGLAATESICKKYPGTKVLVLSMHNNPDYVVRAIQKGARGFALKSLPSEELIKAIEIVQRGEPFFSAQSVSNARNQASKAEGAPHSTDLFEREKEVLVHLAAGFGNKEIGEILSISVRTVESHRARLMRKLNIHTIAGLTRYALSHGYISLNPSFSMQELAESEAHLPSASGLRV